MGAFDDFMQSLVGGSEESSVSNQGGLNVSQGMNVANGINANYGLNEAGSFGTSKSQGQSTSSGSSSSSGGSSSSSSSSGSSQSTQDVWAGQSPFLQEVYKAASAGNADAQAAIQNLSPAIQNQLGNLSQAGTNAYNQQLAGGAAAGMGPSAVGQLQSQVSQMGPTQASQLGPSALGGMQGQGLQQQMLNEYNGSNPYMSGMKDMIAEDAQRLKQQNLGSLDARAAAAGMSGSSGYRNQVSDMMENVDENAMNAMTNLGYQANTQAIQDRMRLSGAADQMNMAAAGAGDQYAMQLAGMNDQNMFNRAGMTDQFNMNQAGAIDQYGMQQAGMMDQNVANALGQTNALQQSAMNQYNPSMMGLQAANQFGQIIGGPTVLGNSSSTNSSTSSGSSYNSSNSVNNSQSTNNSLSNNSSFSNGMNMGLGMNQAIGINGSYGANTGSSAGNGTSSDGLIPAVAQGVAAHKASDARLKTNIRPEGVIDGVNMYSWDWKDDAPVRGDMNYGVLAQEVALTHPDAVSEVDGYLAVDYSKLGRAGRAALSRMGE